jgi:hypothetical protein
MIAESRDVKLLSLSVFGYYFTAFFPYGGSIFAGQSAMFF